jgi:hypothetical protein
LIEHEHAVVVDRRHLAVRIDFEEFRLELVALAGVDRTSSQGRPVSSRNSATLFGFGAPLNRI